MQQDTHKFLGMRRDLHPISQDSKFLWDAKNIRITAREGDTLLSLTNEKGTTKHIPLMLEGYCGHAIVGDWIVIFAVGLGKSIIYRVGLDAYRYEQGECEIIPGDVPLEVCKIIKVPTIDILYIGDLGFDKAHPIQTVADYESLLIQKVYWTDGINQPRMINAAYPELVLENTNRLSEIANFDYPSEEKDTLFTDRGIRQYQSLWFKALTSAQRESETELEIQTGKESRYRKAYYDYSSLFKRGDSQFDFVPTLNLTESINVERIDGTGLFPSGVIQYCITYYDKYGQESNIAYTTGLYNITPPDRGGDPEKRVSCSFKLEISDVDTRFDYLRVYSLIRTTKDAVPTIKRVTDIPITGSTLKYTDDGTTGDTVDPTSLLFNGGETIQAETISAKDSILFLGGIFFERPSVKNAIREYNKNNKDNEFIIPKYGDTANIKVDNGKGDALYIERKPGTYSAGFKAGETYRLGLQFQYKDGTWTEPIFIGDKQMPSKYRISPRDSASPIFRYELKAQLCTYLLERGFKKVRPLIVLPDNTDKDVLVQGVVNPTVFKVNSRNQNSPTAQASWLFRPYSRNSPLMNYDVSRSGIINYKKGFEFKRNSGIPEFRHLMPLHGGLALTAEVQSMVDSFYNILPNYNEAINSEGNAFMSNMYFVDQSILTLNSPDIEFDTSLYPLFDNSSKFNIRLVGVTHSDSTYGDVDISTSSPTIGTEGSGITTSLFGGIEYETLISGLFYEDEAVKLKKDEGKTVDTGGKVGKWVTYLWHRSGSLNNDCNRGTYAGTRSAQLRKKIVANIKFSDRTKFLTKNVNIDTVDLQLFDSNETSILKLKDEEKNGYINYYGNVDQLLVVPEYGLTVNIPNDAYYAGVNETKDLEVYIFEEGSSESLTKDPIKLTINNISFIYGLKEEMITLAALVKNDVTITSNGEPINLEGASIILEDNSTYSTEENDESLEYKYTGYLTTSNKYSLDKKTFVIKKKGNITSYRNPDDIKKLELGQGGLYYMDNTSTHDRLGIEGSTESEEMNLGTIICKDTVRIKYKSTPHLVFNTSIDTKLGVRKPIPSSSKQVVKINVDSKSVIPDIISEDYEDISTGLWVAEVYRDSLSIEEVNDSNYTQYTKFGGLTEEALRDNLWIPANTAISIKEGSPLNVDWVWGDTWLQRYDCLKTYPFTEEDENQVVEIGCVWCETRTNLEGRYDRNKDLHSNINVRPTNFNKVNMVYSQSDNFFNYRILDEDYYKVQYYPSQIIWSLVKAPGDINDIWTSIKSSSQLNLPSTLGRLNKIVAWNENLIGFQDKGIVHILFNSRVQIQASDGVPIEIANSQRVEGYRVTSDIIGCQSPFACTSTPTGIYFVDMNTSSFYRLGEQFVNLGDVNGFTIPLKEMLEDRKTSWVYTYEEEEPEKNGVRVDYDPYYGDVYLTPGYNLYEPSLERPEEAVGSKYAADLSYVYSEKLGQFTSRMNYGGSVLIPYKGTLYAIALEQDTQENWIWTMFTGEYNNIFSGIRDYELTFISNDNPTLTKIFDTIDIEADLFNGKEHTLIEGNINYDTTTFPFNYMRVSNEYQDTGIVPLDTYNFRKKFRVWRATVPRQKNSMNRIRNQWAKITLGAKNPKGNEVVTLHNTSVHYSI